MAGDMSSSAGDNNKKTACVTGGSGYIGSALIKLLLEEGYAVKTTVRNPDDMQKNSHLKGLQQLGPLTVFRADMDEEDSFDDAVAGCDYVFLVAAPLNFSAQDPEKEQIEPAVRGTLNAMRSCVKAGTVRRVILTSSVAAVIRPDLQGDGHGHVLDEDSWSDVEYLRANKPPTWAHCVSKVLLEKEACRFAEEHGISLVTVCPVIVVGAAPAPKARSSIVDCLSLLSGDEAGLAMLKGIQKSSGEVQLVHVDDLCRAELFLAEAAAANGRYICSSLNPALVELARENKFVGNGNGRPQFRAVDILYMFAGVSSSDFLHFICSDDDEERPRVSVSSEKLVREGFQYRHNTLDEIYDNVVEYGKALGILPY
ncbi:anthocyanidin reductase ((2S)-flavan-3-ol-forming)-like [Miscanthus floridulus]|uniref:anthocyanidin reductase ((2S)-flavan-3-ol-forming)-like n=1 Tax=Miscanthus floridulus TaxID=154761 RepID=UPI0034578EAE